MDNKKKKIVGVLVGLIIVAIGIVGIWLMGDNLYETDEPVNTAEDVLLYEEDMNSQPLGIERYVYVLSKADGEYIWADIDESVDMWSVYSVTEESMEVRVAELGLMERGMRVTDMDTVKEAAEIVINNFGVEKEKVDNSYSLSYPAPIEISCLNTEFQGGPEGETYTISPEIVDNGLKLSYDNVTATKVFASTWPEFIDYGYFVAEVEADVTCIENSGTFKDISWIPAKGDTKKVTFVVEFSLEDDMVNFLTVWGIGIAE